MKAIRLLLILFISLDLRAQVLPLDPAIRTGRLANGFTYYIRHNSEPAKRVQFYLVNKVGSVLENDNQRGLAHFMEHMSFNGTKNYPKNELVHYLQKSGVRFGADLNAYTSFDETVYQLPLPTDDPRLLANGLKIMRDWAANATLTMTEINNERGVVLEEKRLGKGAAERMRDKTFPLLLNHSRYADRLPIGTDTVLNHFNRQTILDFYSDWYRPDLQALVVVGDINVDSMELKIKTLFSDLKNPVHEKPRTKYMVPLTGKNGFMRVTDKEFPYTVIQVMIKQRGKELKTLSDYEASLDQSLYNQMLAGRMAELSQKPDPPFIQASADMQAFIGKLDAFTVSIIAKPGQLEPAFSAVWELLQQVKLFGFTDREFERAKADYLSFLASAVREKDKVNSEELVQEYTRNFLTGESAPGIEAEFRITDNYFKRVKLEDLNKLSASYIADSNRNIIVMAPQKDSASLPDSLSVNQWIASVAKMNIRPYADPFADEALLGDSLTAGTITAEHSLPALGITTLTLSNGLQVILKPTNFKNDEIRFQGFSPGGTSLYDDSDFESASSAVEIVQRSGIGHFKPADLPKVLSGKQLNVQPYISERTEGVAGVSTSRDLETAMQLVHLYFTSPRRDSTIFKNILEESKDLIANRNSDPASVFADTVAAVLGNYSIRRTGPTLEKLNKINFDRALSIYKERFASASDFTFLFVGSFTADRIKPLLEKYLGSLPAGTPKEQARDLKIHIPAGKIEATAYKGKEAKSTVRLVISGNYTYSEKNNIQITALGEILQFRILDRLREKEGGAYSPRVQVTFNKNPVNRYAFTIVFGCAPENVSKLIVAAREEIQSLKTMGASKLDITKFASEETRQYELQLKDNQSWLNYLDTQYENGDDPSVILQYPDLIKEVTPATVKAAANRYLDENNFIRLVLMPEKSTVSAP